MEFTTLTKRSIGQKKAFDTFAKESTEEMGIYIWLSFNKCVYTSSSYLLDSVLGTKT